MSSLWEFLAAELAKSGSVTLEVVNQGSHEHQFCSVSGLGVQAAGYRSIEEALAAWKETIQRA